MLHISSRRKWYIGFGISLILVLVMVAFFISIRIMILFGLIISLIGIYDILQTKHSILRNFPILGHIRYILEFIRPEIQQYFIATDQNERPFDRQMRNLIYRRAKGLKSTLPFGTDRDITKPGYEWVLHSLSPISNDKINKRIVIGNSQCERKYLSSRLNISAMSYGALSKNAIIALNKAAKLGDFCHNTGEGGLTEHHLQGGDLTLQVGTGYFGFRTLDGAFDAKKFKEKASLENVKMIEIKISQGAKPSHGGILPKEKITREIAEIRNVSTDKDVISPPTHSEFSTPIELCQFIKKLRHLSSGKPVGFKLCLGLKTNFFSICKAILETKVYPDFITIDGAEGGTGAAPQEFVNRVGVPLENAVPFIHNALVGSGIRSKICIIASGKVITGFDMVKLIALGADVINSARSMMLALGCIQSKQCNKNTCPTGVATQNPRLFRALDIKDKSQRVFRFHKYTTESFYNLVGAMGLDSPDLLKPSRVMRKINEENIKSFDEIYDYVENGCFLDTKSIPKYYAKYWSQAQPEKF